MILSSLVIINLFRLLILGILLLIISLISWSGEGNCMYRSPSEVVSDVFVHYNSILLIWVFIVTLLFKYNQFWSVQVIISFYVHVPIATCVYNFNQHYSHFNTTNNVSTDTIQVCQRKHTKTMIILVRNTTYEYNYAKLMIFTQTLMYTTWDYVRCV